MQTIRWMSLSRWPACASARWSSSSAPASWIPVSTSTMPSVERTANAFTCGTPGHGSGSRRRQTPVSTLSARPSSRLPSGPLTRRGYQRRAATLAHTGGVVVDDLLPDGVTRVRAGNAGTDDALGDEHLSDRRAGLRDRPRPHRRGASSSRCCPPGATTAASRASRSRTATSTTQAARTSSGRRRTFPWPPHLEGVMGVRSSPRQESS